MHTGSTSDNCVTFDLLTSGSMYAEQLPCTICLPNLVLTAQAVFLLEHGHQIETHKAIDATAHGFATGNNGRM